MPIPVPDEVTEAWLLGWPERWGNLPKSSRDKAARLLYEHLTEEQVRQLRTGRGILTVGKYDIHFSRESWPYIYDSTDRGQYSCMSFGGKNGTAHEVYPVCDYILSLKLALETGQVRNLRQVYGGDTLLIPEQPVPKKKRA